MAKPFRYLQSQTQFEILQISGSKFPFLLQVFLSYEAQPSH